MVKNVLTWSFYILFLVTPLFFTPYNHELFEFNKMLLVYTLTSIITVFWLLRIIRQKEIIFRKTPLDLPLMLFLLSQIISTIFSIDHHTSIFGFYSRLNGGLLSTICYILLYYALVSNFTKEDIIKFFKSTLIGGLLVSLYAIPEHFGVSPSCVILTHNFTASCWVQDVQSRVFATLGQPNWLGAYLGMLIFPAIFFAVSEKGKLQTLLFSISAVAFYTAFTFTYSRGAALGFVVALIIPMIIFALKMLSISKKDFIKLLLNVGGSFIFASIWGYFVDLKTNNLTSYFGRLVIFPAITFIIHLAYLKGKDFTKIVRENSLNKNLVRILVAFLVINLLFGSALTGSLRLIKQNAPPARPTISSGGTQLEQGGTESGQIRLIVWKGALDIFRHYPWFGSGVETFAYSYYNFRPAEHNLTSEWDFLYNKAHNEYLNYLSTTGIFGFLTYLAIITTFILWAIKLFFSKNTKLDKTGSFDPKLLTLATLSSYISYLIQNAFGFSIVMIALLFFLFPAMTFVYASTNQQTGKKPNKNSKVFAFYNLLTAPFNKFITKTMFNNSLINKMSQFLLAIFLIMLLVQIINFWFADYFFNKGSQDSESSDLESALTNLNKAVNLNPTEPLYNSELGFALSSYALSLKDEDSTKSAQVAKLADIQTQVALKSSPKNLSYHRTAVRTYYQLSNTKEEELYLKKAMDELDISISLAPTDPKLYYNKGLLLSQSGNIKEGLNSIQKAADLKPNYTEAHFTLSLLYEQQGDKEKALREMEEVLKLDPTNDDAKKKIAELKEAKK